MTRRARALIELFARTSGASAAALAIPLFGGVGLAAAILFAGNGMSARDVVALERSSAPARAALWTGWIVLSVPPARALIGAPSAAWLRSLPSGRAPFVALLVTALVALQIPWITLFARASGAPSGLGAGLLAAALAAGIASFRAMRWEALTLLAPLAAIALPLPPAPSMALALPACWLAAHAGFFRGTALPRLGIRLVRGPAPIAVAGALLAGLARADRASLIRSLLTAAAGGALGALGARNNQRLDASFPWMVLPIATVPLVVGAGVVAGPIARADAALAWLLATTGTRPATRVAARSLSAVSVGALSGLVAAATAVLVAPVSTAVALTTTAALAAWSACLTALALFATLRASRTGKREGGVVLASLCALCILALITSVGFDAAAPFLALAATLVAAAKDTLDEARR